MSDNSTRPLPPGYTIRPAQPKDLAGVMALLKPFVEQRKILRRTRLETSALLHTGFVAEYHPAEYQPAEYQPAEYQPAEYQPAEHHSAEHHSAEGTADIVGFSSVEIYSKKLSEIQCLAVSDAHQGRGLGGQLVRHCVELARKRGVMEVMAISSSEKFLHDLGFDYSLPNQKRALFYQLRSREEVHRELEEAGDD